MKMVVGLGNPGRKYWETRHNVGFNLIDELSRRHSCGFPRARFQGETADVDIDGEKLLLLRPHTYMNRSGESVQQARDFFKLENSDVLVVCDDFSLPLGKLRVRTKGSAGGQKGLADIIQRLGTELFPRLRIGIGSPPPEWDPADFVLSKFAQDEVPFIKEATTRAADAVKVWLQSGIEVCMNQYNSS